MYLEAKIRIPENIPGLTTKTIKGTTYVYYTFSRTYNAEKKYSSPSGTSVGKCIPDEPGMMYPNHNFLRFFPEIDLPEERDETYRTFAFIIVLVARPLLLYCEGSFGTMGNTTVYSVRPTYWRGLNGLPVKNSGS